MKEKKKGDRCVKTYQKCDRYVKPNISSGGGILLKN